MQIRILFTLTIAEYCISRTDNVIYIEARLTCRICAISQVCLPLTYYIIMHADPRFSLVQGRTSAEGGRPYSVIPHLFPMEQIPRGGANERCGEFSGDDHTWLCSMPSSFFRSSSGRSPGGLRITHRVAEKASVSCNIVPFPDRDSPRPRRFQGCLKLQSPNITRAGAGHEDITTILILSRLRR